MGDVWWLRIMCVIIVRLCQLTNSWESDGNHTELYERRPCNVHEWLRLDFLNSHIPGEFAGGLRHNTNSRDMTFDFSNQGKCPLVHRGNVRLNHMHTTKLVSLRLQYHFIPILCTSLTCSMCTSTGRYPSSTRKSDALYSNREYVHIAQHSDHAAPFNNDQSWCEVGGSNPCLNSLSIHAISIVAFCGSAIEAQRKVSVVHQDAT